MGKLDELLQGVGDSFTRAMDNEIKPGDENQKAASLQNYLIDKLGLPPDWQTTVAQDKEYYQNLPMQMGMSGGTIGKVGAQAAEKLGASAAARIAESKALGNTVHVIPDAAERIMEQNAAQGKPRFGKLTIK